MKIVPLINALLVTTALYALVFERDRLMSFAGAQTAPEDAAPVRTAETAKPVPVQVLRSTARPVDQGVLLRGETQAARRVELRAETTGRVISEPLRRGAEVAAGDTLCRLDPGTRPAQLTEAEARLTEAELNATASDRLQAGGYRSDTAAAGAKAALQAAQAAVEAVRTDIARLAITAPFGGVLEEDSAELGALLGAGGLCATVIALDPIRLVGFVPETELARVAPGALVGARLATGQEVTGRVSYLSRSADPATRTFRVEAEIANPDGHIREGQSVEMLIAAEGARAHLLPASVLTLDDRGTLGVRLAVEGVARFAPVRVLRDEPGGLWLAGLPETAEVIVVGQDYVTDGSALAATLVDRAPGDAPGDAAGDAVETKP
ncbi:MAG: efflux RND transporter periplasmic adaptor subunit [Sphingomonadales bacterium]|nr:efflux RND transporter periplasmic adaptor subunit [Sphingomonadales bacterium]